MAPIELWWSPGTCSRATLVALEEIGEPFETRLTPRERARNSDFLALNPKGKVPVLSIDSRLLTETPAILTYLARRHPAANLLPSAEPEALDALITMSWIAGGIHPSITRLRFPRRYCDTPGSEDSVRLHAAAMLRDCFEVVERRLAGRDWLFERWSAVDAYLLWAWFRAVGSGMDGSGLTSCAAHAARCEARPSVARALDREEAAYAELLAAGEFGPDAPPNQVGRAPVPA